ncbi:acyl-CoA dehydrogenase family protein [Novosphingobium resinovorum]|uniref:acyl-CoA dehydrogenase family protein n=1 Tax=Sphingomonadaceae TaxID=41297 RepID=UPI00027C9F71|nr:MULTISPECIES: acyl-CoA dehydrogenase family protein [Sphingomonadaceae]EJU12325.1 acyl-CoA dehydrogenase [Sphingomonas sp. LH128]MBF7011584.1 acyl-CoA/acyl-ACP dehydrogenase [Novosphingobium sp. HR1a]WJM29556.1 acyl-CoA dehydrogenase family protein [Novosphingobium resinovorum]
MIELNELTDAAQKAFPADALSPGRDESWRLVAEMGWLMVRLPEEDGGLGLDREASAAIHFEMGRVLATTPLIPAQLGLQAVLASEIAARVEWLERLAGGEYAPLHLLPAKLEAAPNGTLSGVVGGVFDADMAVAVVAKLPGGYALVPTDAPGVSIVERAIWDPSRRLFDIVLDGYAPDPALMLTDADGAAALHDALAPEAHLAVAADCLGAANAALELTIEYMKMRRQFDRPIAMFQALKHRAADMKARIAVAEALLWNRVRDDAATLVQCAAAKTLAAEAFAFVTEEAIQLHGGIGLTEEHPIHRFMKRAMLNLQLCGSPDLWNERTGREALG